MTYRGHVQNGTIVLDGPAKLPEGSQVEVHPLPPPAKRAPTAKKGRVPTVADRLRPLIGCLKGYPSDMAENHDHYAYGAPKRR